MCPTQYGIVCLQNCATQFCIACMLQTFSSNILFSLLFLSLNRDVDDVHDMMDDIQEQNELADEITNALSNPVGFGQDVDEV